MNVQMILLRFGELTLKGKNRSRFENQVLQHAKYMLRSFPRLHFIKTYGRIYIELNGEPYEQVAAALGKVFGLSSFSPVHKAEPNLASIRETALQAVRELPNRPKTFKVSVRRADKHFPHSSQELNGLIGGYVLRHMNGLKVDVHRPDVDLRVEIREEGVFVYSEVVPGLGGYPFGSSGKAMLMLSGGIDSPVAGWLGMKRGLVIEAVHFHSFPYTSERAQQKVVDLTRQLAGYTNGIKLHMVPFTEIQTKLRGGSRDNLLITLMRRAMFRITEKLAEKHDALAIVTGESLGQVASQTLSNMYTINQVVRMPILRPLITMDKTEIIRIAEMIETYPISILPYEDCCTLFVPKNPTTNPSLRVVERIESRLEWLSDEIDKAVEHTETEWISQDTPGTHDELF